jgi:hypothetical protein
MKPEKIIDGVISMAMGSCATNKYYPVLFFSKWGISASSSK